jgi:hypothetical protein
MLFGNRRGLAAFGALNILIVGIILCCHIVGEFLDEDGEK